MADGHNVNGVRLDLYAIEADWPDLWGVPELLGADLVIPYREGELPGERTVGARDYSVALDVHGETRGEYLTKAAALVTLIWQGGAVVTLGRELNGVTKTAEARYISGLPIKQIAPNLGRALVRWRLYSGDFA